MKSSKILSIQTNVDTQDNDVSNSNDDENMSKYIILDDAPFVLVEGADGWFIVMGEHIVSEKRFKTKDEAKLYVDSKPYELIYVGASAYMKILEKIQNDSNNFKNLNNEQES
jgi:hypothetical protein